VKTITAATLESRSFHTVFKKGYIKLFLIALSILMCGLVIMTIISIIPQPSYLDPGYENYQNIVKINSALAKLFVEIGLVLFSVSSFIGAITDRDLTDNVKRGMMIASGISILGLTIVFLYPIILYGVFWL
jgi:hypothetical protein